VLRGKDGAAGAGFRMALQIQKPDIEEDGPAFQYKLVFDAFASEAKTRPIELGHAGSEGKDEWTWIEPKTSLAHHTVNGNTFKLRSHNNEAVFNGAEYRTSNPTSSMPSAI
jgi:hypothetical protein